MSLLKADSTRPVSPRPVPEDLPAPPTPRCPRRYWGQCALSNYGFIGAIAGSLALLIGGAGVVALVGALCCCGGAMCRRRRPVPEPEAEESLLRECTEGSDRE